jgi:hypothetical protein
MATDTNETSTGDERDESATSQDSGGESSQEEMAEKARQEYRQRRKESERKAGPLVLAACVCLVALGLLNIYLSTTVLGSHPLVTDGMAVLGVADLGLGLAIFIRKNWPRTTVLAMMPVNFIGVLLCVTLLISSAKYLAFPLCVAVLLLMFRQPILDEFDAPEE